MPAKTKLSEQSLITAIALRQRIGAEALYDMYAGSLLNSILQIVKNREVAEDVLQLALMRIWDSFNKYDPQKGRLYTWMVTIARNTAIMAVRSGNCRQQNMHTDIANVWSDVDRKYFTSFNIDTLGLRELMQSLKTEYREILELIYYHGYTHAEVAEALLMPIGTVKTRWTMGIKILRHQMAFSPAA